MKWLTTQEELAHCRPPLPLLLQGDAACSASHSVHPHAEKMQLSGRWKLIILSQRLISADLG